MFLHTDIYISKTFSILDFSKKERIFSKFGKVKMHSKNKMTVESLELKVTFTHI